MSTSILHIKVSKDGDRSRGRPEDSLFNNLLLPRCKRRSLLFSGLLCFTLDMYLIMMSVKQGGIKYNFLSL